MSVIWAVAGFVLAMGILVTIHEMGHYLVARFFNIKVTDFSIGFGKTLFSKQGKETKFQIAMIPLGGYVKFLDEREGSHQPISGEDYTRAYNRQNVFVRFAVVLAGPLVNLVFAWILFSFIYFAGVTGFKPVFEQTVEASPVSTMLQGLNKSVQIMSIDGRELNTWRETDQRILLALVSKQEHITLTLASFQLPQEIFQIKLPLSNLDINNPKQSRLNQLGFIPKIPPMPPLLGEIKLNTPAEIAGFKHGDEILSINGTPIESWKGFVNKIEKSANQEVEIVFSRQGVVFLKKVEIASRERGDKQIGFFGSTVLFDEQIYAPYQSQTNYSFSHAMSLGYEHSIDLVNMTLSMIKRMLFGEVDVANLSGPISIADYSGQALQLGIGSFFNLLALLSLSLGILNLLPIPVLDGGNLVLYIAEMIKGVPLNTRFELLLQQFGIFLILSLTLFAIINDVVRISND
jgi:regulator of sigma E protease